MSASRWRNRGHSAYGAFLLHRVSGLALALFLPFHFWVLSEALEGAGRLDAMLAWTQQPLVKAAEIGLVFLLAAHLTGGLRLLFVEFYGWQREAHPVMIAAAGGIGVFCALAFALNLL
jgi:fumarate reductase subunit D